MKNKDGCIFCGIESHEEVISENGFSGKKCPQCGLIYISPKPSLESIINLYGHDDAHIPSESHISASFVKRLYARHYLKIISTFSEPGNLLDIGAGGGHFLDEARKLGYSPHGLELNPYQANHIKETLKIQCEQSPISSSLFGGKKFDVVFHCDVISHFYEPIEDFKKINQVMKEGSYLIFETGNLGDVDHKYFKYFTKFQYPDHLFFFGTDNLNDLLERTGFATIKMYRYSILPQLILIKALTMTRSLLRKISQKPSRSLDQNSNTHKPLETQNKSKMPRKPKSGLKIFLTDAYGYVSYLLRYHAGKFCPDKHAPQTVIVVARKVRDVD